MSSIVEGTARLHYSIQFHIIGEHQKLGSINTFDDVIARIADSQGNFLEVRLTQPCFSKLYVRWFFCREFDTS